jgi:hypothetical protein
MCHSTGLPLDEDAEAAEKLLAALALAADAHDARSSGAKAVSLPGARDFWGTMRRVAGTAPYRLAHL